MNIELKVDPADIEKQVTDAIVASAFGTRLKEAVEAALKNLGDRYSYQDELRKLIEHRMRQIVMQYIQQNYTPQIEERIKQLVTEDTLKAACDKVASYAISQLRIGKEY